MPPLQLLSYDKPRRTDRQERSDYLPILCSLVLISTTATCVTQNLDTLVGGGL